MRPRVSFIIPCYKYACFLAECVNSILAQTYGDFEIIIMDDCSPDDTSQVADSFKDLRVRYIRNKTNLGNVQNYNKGILESRGSYVWLISADDKLRSATVLAKYLDVLMRNPHVGYAFCPAVALQDGKEKEIEAWSAWPGGQDRILQSHELLIHSAYACPVCAPTGLARRECYERLGLFPTELKRTGDWYLWGLFATEYDVAYFAEPMVCYRLHESNMEKTLEQEHAALFWGEELRVRWRIKEAAEKVGMSCVLPDFQGALADAYALRIARKTIQHWSHGLTHADAAQDIRRCASGDVDAKMVLHLLQIKLPNVYTVAGARAYSFGQYDEAITAFRAATEANKWSFKPPLYWGLVLLERIFGIRIIPSLNRLKIGPFHLFAKSHLAATPR